MRSSKKLITANWPAPKHIYAYTTTIDHGNLADHIGDNINEVTRNRQQLSQQLQLPNQPTWLKQVHGCDVVILPASNKPTADASITRQSQQICTVLTADCVPILLSNESGTEIAAIHAGWRGLLYGVISNTIAKLHSPTNTMMAWLGPAISRQAYAISEQMMVDFLQRNPDNKACFTKVNHQFFADLYQLARIELNNHGITKHFGGQYCTYTQSDWFFSYRRDNAKAGRMATLIWITQ